MAQWVPDGSSGFNVDGNTVTLVDESGGGNVFNCLWDDGNGVASGAHYWKIHFDSLDDEGGVGLTSKDRFKEGFACRSLAYSRNLTNGGGLLVSDFGAAPSAGDTVGIYASFVDDRLKVYIDINGTSVGLAFDVPASTFDSVYPIVFFNNSGSATCHKESEPPSNIERAAASFNGIEGDWKLKELVQENGEPVAVPEELQSNLTTKLRKDGDAEYVWNTVVVNSLRTRLWLENDTWQTSDVQSTRRLGDPDEMTVESNIIGLISGLSAINVNDDEELSIKCDTVSSVWTRFDNSAKPFVGEPF